MKTINCYLKSLKFAMYFIPMIPLNYPSTCLLAVCRETIKANLLLQINSWVSIPEDRKCKVQRKHWEKINRDKYHLWKYSTVIFRRFYTSEFNSKFLAKLGFSWKMKISHFVNILYTIWMGRYYEPIVLHFFRLVFGIKLPHMLCQERP